MHTSAVLNAEESLKGQPLAPSFFLLLPLFSFGSVILSFPPPSFSPPCFKYTQTERPSATLAAKLTQLFSHSWFVTLMKQPAARLYQYHLADDAPEGVTSRFCTLLRLCPNVYKLPSVSVRVQAGSPASPHRSVCTTQKLDVSRCCFVFMGRLSYKSPLQKLSPRSLLSLRLFVVYPGFFFSFPLPWQRQCISFHNVWRVCFHAYFGSLLEGFACH